MSDSMSFPDSGFCTLEQLQELRKLVDSHKWTWEQFTRFTVDSHFQTIPSCLSHAEAASIIRCLSDLRAVSRSYDFPLQLSLGNDENHFSEEAT